MVEVDFVQFHLLNLENTFDIRASVAVETNIRDIHKQLIVV